MLRETKNLLILAEAAIRGDTAFVVHRGDDEQLELFDFTAFVRSHIEVEGARMVCEIKKAPEANAACGAVNGPVEQDDELEGKNGKKKIDHGKIIALHNAGWNASAIADEMNIGIGTVYRHVQSEEEKVSEEK